MKRLLVLGFYNRANLGDEMFKETIPLLVPDFTCDFISTDDFIKNEVKPSVDPLYKYHAIICGGGDIFNDYFLPKIRKILATSKGYDGPIYLLGVGIPYPSYVTSEHLSIFDHVFLRETTDLSVISRKIGSRYVHSLPDLGFLKIPKANEKISHGIGVFLANTLPKDAVDQIKHVLENLSTKGQIYLYKFNTSGNPKEDDITINSIMETYLKSKNINVVNDSTVYNTDQMIEIMSKLDFAVCARFHAHIFCTIAGCPFISVGITRKVQLFLDEEDISILGPKDPLTSIDSLWSTRKEISIKLLEIAQANRYRLQTKQINALLLRKDMRSKTPSIDVYEKARLQLFQLSGYDINSKSTPPNISEAVASKVSASVCFDITSSPGSKYEWGTTQNIMKKPKDLKEMIKWIQEDVESSYTPGLDLDFYNQNGLKGLHRAGWQYVLGYLKVLQDSKGVLCDTFADRSFLWGRWVLKENGILPYTSQWIGFIHHTPNTEYTENNCYNIINSKEFIQSLPTCKGIICLSEYLAEWFRTRFPKLKIIVLMHPTQFIDTIWNPQKINWDKLKLVNVGAWYRNPFTIYSLKVPSWIQKYHLKGPHMDSHFPPEDFNPTKMYPGNEWVKYMGSSHSHHNVESMLKSVEIISLLDNNSYDDLLSESIVFLHLVDASAANTVIECIVRGTPLLVNRLPALEEYLGSKYPLFYDTTSEISSLLTKEIILQTHFYLKDLDKRNLHIETFLNKLNAHLQENF